MPAGPSQPEVATPRATAPGPAPDAGPGRLTTLGRRVPAPVVAGAWILAIAALAYLLVPGTHVGYDTSYAIASAQDLLAGRTNGYALGLKSPLPHPLVTVEALVAVALAPNASPVFVALTLLAFGVLIWATYRLAARLFGWPAGIVAALALASGVEVLRLVGRTYLDIPFAAAVVCAILLEVGRPRRGVPVLLALGVAGLLRPEAWVLAGAYWLHLVLPPLAQAREAGRPWRARLAPRRSTREAIGLAVLALAAPLLWMLHDALLTGDPLFSRNRTADFAAGEESSLTLADLPVRLWEALDALVGIPLLAAAAVGIALGRRHARRASLLLVAVIALGIAVTIVLGIGGLTFQPRFLLVPGVLLIVLAAGGLAGWITREEGRARLPWAAAAGALAIAFAAFAPATLDELDDLRDTQHRLEATVADANGLARSPRARAYMVACPPVYVPDFLYRPALRYALDVPPRTVYYGFPGLPDGPPPGPPARGVILVPAAPPLSATRRSMRRAGRRALRGGGFRAVAANRRWTLYARASCRPPGPGK